MQSAEIIQLIAQQGETNELYSLVCTVDSVDEGQRTCSCTPLNGGVAIHGVRLQAVIGGTKGLTIFPVVKSSVVVTFLSKQSAYVAIHSDVDGYIIETGEESLNTILTDLIDAITALTVTTGVGPSGTPINVAAFEGIKNRLSNLFKG